MKVKFKVAIVVIFSSCLLFLLIFAVINNNQKYINTSANPSNNFDTIIIDAGHGGEDGGAVIGEIVEKDINLEISLKLEKALKSMGYNVIMTRTEDKLIYDPAESKTMRQKKSADIHKRTDIVNKSNNAILISIHQNKYPSPSSKGAQVFYSPKDSRSEVLAQNIQSAIGEMLQPKNKRMIKKSGTNIYMLYNAKIPAVMVECGFISNPNECKNLRDDEYQNKMVYCILCGILKFA